MSIEVSSHELFFRVLGLAADATGYRHNFLRDGETPPRPRLSDYCSLFRAYQCDGDDYDGPTCCRPGYECSAIADCYSEVRLWQNRVPHLPVSSWFHVSHVLPRS